MKDNFDPHIISQPWKDDESLVKQNKILLGQQSVQALFKEYYFDYRLCNLCDQDEISIRKLKKKVLISQKVFFNSQTTGDTTNKAS